MNRPLKVFLCHIMPVGYAHADRDSVRALPEGARLTKDGVDAWLADKINIASKGTLRAKNPLIRYAIR